VACVVVIFAGCSGASPTAAPTAVPRTQAPLPSGQPFPTVGFAHDASDLEAMLPSIFNNARLTSTSGDATSELTADAAGQTVAAFLAGLGKTPADLKVAEAFDPDGNAGATFVAFRAVGVDAAALMRSMILAGLFVPKTATPPPNIPAAVTIGGKSVIAIPQGRNTDYLYAKGDVLFDVRTADPALAATALGLLP
jgi:hypothetical protein